MRGKIFSKDNMRTKSIRNTNGENSYGKFKHVSSPFQKKKLKTFNTKSRKNSTNQPNIPGSIKTCHVALFKSNFFLSHSDLIPFSLSYFVSPFSLWNSLFSKTLMTTLLSSLLSFSFTHLHHFGNCNSYGTSEGFSASQFAQKQYLQNRGLGFRSSLNKA